MNPLLSPISTVPPVDGISPTLSSTIATSEVPPREAMVDDGDKMILLESSTKPNCWVPAESTNVLTFDMVTLSAARVNSVSTFKVPPVELKGVIEPAVSAPAIRIG
ncbi:MAG: hypothetical protein ACTSVW_00355 [Candidatus Njordarchaeales archaeon]